MDRCCLHCDWKPGFERGLAGEDEVACVRLTPEDSLQCGARHSQHFSSSQSAFATTAGMKYKSVILYKAITHSALNRRYTHTEQGPCNNACTSSILERMQWVTGQCRNCKYCKQYRVCHACCHCGAAAAQHWLRGPCTASLHMQWKENGIGFLRCSCARGPAARSDASRMTMVERSCLPSYLQHMQQGTCDFGLLLQRTQGVVH